MKLKTSWHCAKWNGLNTDFIIQYILYFKNFCGSVNILLYAIFFLKWRINWRRFWLQCILWSSKIYISFDSRLSLYLFLNGHIHNVVSTLLNFVKNYSGSGNVFSTLSNVHINVEKDDVDSTFFKVMNFNVDVHNVVSTLILRSTMSRRHINLKITLKFAGFGILLHP